VTAEGGEVLPPTGAEIGVSSGACVQYLESIMETEEAGQSHRDHLEKRQAKVDVDRRAQWIGTTEV
jgi:hypothetical protein